MSLIPHRLFDCRWADARRSELGLRPRSHSGARRQTDLGTVEGELSLLYSTSARNSYRRPCLRDRQAGQTAQPAVSSESSFTRVDRACGSRAVCEGEAAPEFETVAAAPIANCLGGVSTPPWHGQGSPRQMPRIRQGAQAQCPAKARLTPRLAQSPSPNCILHAHLPCQKQGRCEEGLRHARPPNLSLPVCHRLRLFLPTSATFYRHIGVMNVDIAQQQQKRRAQAWTR